MNGARSVGLLVRASHPGPTVAVTTLAVLLAVAGRIAPGGVAAVGVAVLAGQLSIGWSNDLLDLARDRRVNRRDKPIATGELPVNVVQVALVITLLVSAAASAVLGPAAGAVHLLLVVGSGWAYNVGLKRTAASFVPYAMAFGSLPAVVQLAGPAAGLPPAWLLTAGALLGVGVHLVNALPDLADDASTGVTGLPQRLGERRSRRLATVLLLAGTVAAVLGPAPPRPAWVWAAVVAVGVLAVVIMVARGAVPFRAALGVALIDAVVLVGRSVAA